MSLFDDQLADFRELPPPFNGRNSLTDYKKKTSDVPLSVKVHTLPFTNFFSNIANGAKRPHEKIL